MTLRLLAVTGPKAGVAYALEPGVSVLGRASASRIQLVDDAVSRRHARVEVAADATLEDLGSQNGTFVNGAAVRGPVTLRPGDVVRIGASTFVVEPDVDYLVGAGADVMVAEGATASVAGAAAQGDESSPEADAMATRVLAALGGDQAPVAAALTALAEAFGAARGFVVRVAPGAADPLERPRVVASFGEGPIVVSRTVVRAALETRQALVSEDATGDTLLRGGVSLQAGGIRSLLAAPLLAGDRVLGMVHLDRPVKGAYGADDLQRLLPFARVLGVALLAEDGLAQRVTAARAHHRVEAPALIAADPVTKAVLQQADRAAASAANVLITGPTGVGKEVFARRIHARSDRARGPFVAVNCGALPDSLQESALFGHAKGAFTGADRDHPGLFEAAEGGTLFLDEVQQASRGTQVSLLRALQERVVTRLGETRPRTVDVRVVAASSVALDAAVAEGAFREDLYFRLAVVPVEVPRLSRRPGDIGPLACHFVEAVCAGAGVPSKTLSMELEAALTRYGWPGNVRELRNVVERMVILAEGSELTLADLPADLASGPEAARQALRDGEGLAGAVARLERALIEQARVRTGGVKTAAAEALGISRVTLDKKLRDLGIEWPSRRRG